MKKRSIKQYLSRASSSMGGGVTRTIWVVGHRFWNSKENCNIQLYHLDKRPRIEKKKIYIWFTRSFFFKGDNLLCHSIIWIISIIQEGECYYLFKDRGDTRPFYLYGLLQN